MFLSRLALVLLLPFLAGAVLPWLHINITPRVLVITLIWNLCIALFVAGVALGASLSDWLKTDDQHASVVGRLRYLAMAVLWVLGLLVYFAFSPLLALLILAAAQLMAMKTLVATALWRQVPSTQQHFLARIGWVSLGCQLMLALSVLRMAGGVG